VRSRYDADCPLCPGNRRASGARNPAYRGSFVFDNDFPALALHGPAEAQRDSDELFTSAPESGACRVVCLSDRHDLSFADLAHDEVVDVLNVLRQEYVELGSASEIAAVTIFENRGAMMGASNPHPHCQIWANESLPQELFKESQRQREYLERHARCLLCAYARREEEAGDRVVYENDHIVIVVPFWAVWPYETLVMPRAHRTGLDELSVTEVNALGEALKTLVRAYDSVFDVLFPYSMGFHQRPTDGDNHPEWHLHAHYYPPLLRSASIRKFVVGYELLAQAQRDTCPEEAAATLRGQTSRSMTTR